MARRQFLCVGLTLAVAAGGCHQNPQTAPPSSAQPKPPAVSTTNPPAGSHRPSENLDTEKPVIIDDPHSTADAVAQKAKAYAQNLEPLVARRAGNTARPATADARGPAAPAQPQAPGEPSSVQWQNPEAGPPGTSAGKAPKDPASSAAAGENTAAANPPAPRPPADVAANQVASIAQTAPPAPVVTQTPVRQEVVLNKDTPSANTPLVGGQPPLAGVDELSRRFAQQVKDYPNETAAHLDLQLLQFLQGQSVPQMQSLSTLPAEDREMLSALLDGLTMFRNGLRTDNNMLLSKKIRPLLDLSDRLRTQAELTIPTVALCREVKGFGVYDPIEPARFEAGREQRAIVYCEVENFSSQLDPQKRWETKLTQEIVLYTEQNGLEVWRDKVAVGPIFDYSRNRRHDFFIRKPIRLPAQLTIGRYLMKVTVVDQQVNRVAENSVPIQIVAQ
ncbi:MAG: hypothetical protein JWL69_2418 [Phycisphaerales bacterium]|nr:hypothetical protein [Phycisphaerales bacterium]MDB5354817.1 hypothetical protein [Phycisphaerales bacterium]